MTARRNYQARKKLIRDELVRCAQSGEFPFYMEFGEAIGVPARGPWKTVLDDISREETAKGLPDITFVLRNKSTGYPGQIGFVEAGKPSPAQRALARGKAQEVIDKYCPGAKNPF